MPACAANNNGEGSSKSGGKRSLGLIGRGDTCRMDMVKEGEHGKLTEITTTVSVGTALPSWTETGSLTAATGETSSVEESKEYRLRWRDLQQQQRNQ